MNQNLVHIQEARIHLLRWFKDLTKEDIRFRAIGEKSDNGTTSQIIIFWGPRFTGDLLKIRITDNNGVIQSEVLNANGLSLLPHTNRTKDFFHQMGMLAGGKGHAHS